MRWLWAKPAAAVLKRCKRRVAAIEADLAAGLSAAEERALRRFLVRVAVESGGSEAGL